MNARWSLHPVRSPELAEARRTSPPARLAALSILLRFGVRLHLGGGGVQPREADTLTRGARRARTAAPNSAAGAVAQGDRVEGARHARDPEAAARARRSPAAARADSRPARSPRRSPGTPRRGRREPRRARERHRGVRCARTNTFARKSRTSRHVARGRARAPRARLTGGRKSTRRVVSLPQTALFVIHASSDAYVLVPCFSATKCAHSAGISIELSRPCFEPRHFKTTRAAHLQTPPVVETSHTRKIVMTRS